MVILHFINLFCGCPPQWSPSRAHRRKRGTAKLKGLGGKSTAGGGGGGGGGSIQSISAFLTMTAQRSAAVTGICGSDPDHSPLSTWLCQSESLPRRGKESLFKSVRVDIISALILNDVILSLSIYFKSVILLQIYQYFANYSEKWEGRYLRHLLRTVIYLFLP